MQGTQDLQGKAIVVTGAGSGIGEAYAKHIAAAGGRVIVNDIDVAMADRVASAIRSTGAQAEAVAADVSDWCEAGRLIDACEQTFGRIDGLVNNAGVFHMALPEEQDETALRRLLEVNVLGTAFCGTHAIRRMLAHGSGAIVNVTSGAQTGITRLSAYGASKGAVASLTYGWAVDLADKGIRVNAISPMGKSGMSARVQAYFATRDEPAWPELAIPAENNAPVVVYLLSDAAAQVNGQVVRIDGTQLSLMSHPAVMAPVHECEAWSVEGVRAVFDTSLAKQQAPLGVVVA